MTGIETVCFTVIVAGQRAYAQVSGPEHGRTKQDIAEQKRLNVYKYTFKWYPVCADEGPPRRVSVRGRDRPGRVDMSKATETAFDEDEWTVEGFLAECDRITTNPPPVPDGFELVGCGATPRHWPTYLPVVDGQYPATCFLCERDSLDDANRRLRCERDHHRWKSWRGWWRIASRLYQLGVTSSGGSVSMGRCEFCGITRQHMAPHWRGQRSYILGLRREAWTCLRHGHRYSPTDYGMCSVCCPCPSCGSTDPNHSGDCGEVSR